MGKDEKTTTVPLQSKTTIGDLMDIVHFTIIKKHPSKRNDIILTELQSIEKKIEKGELENYNISHPMWWTCVFKDVGDNGYHLFDASKPAEKFNQKKPHIRDYMKAMSGEDIKRAVKAFRTWQTTGEWKDADSQLHKIQEIYFAPMGEVGVSGLMSAYNTVTDELAKRLFDEGQ